MNTSISTLHKFQTLAILVLIFADGCDVGQFSLSSFDVWSIGGIINVLLHALAGFIFMGFGIQFFYSPQRLTPRTPSAFIPPATGWWSLPLLPVRCSGSLPCWWNEHNR